MLQGTGSDVGKSLLVAGLCRAFARRGLRVRPFKPQNMSNNAAVAADGGEIGRAQALQARAAQTAPIRDMNPVLLKPQSDGRAQLVVHGRLRGTLDGRGCRARRRELLAGVLASFARLGADADLVLVEGAGSAAEANLRAADIANMGFAEAADVPVVLVGDIDRGGVIAQMIGTWALWSPGERARTAGFIVNKFRGDAGRFADGLAIIETRTGLDSLGVVPWFADAARLPAEDAVGVESRSEARAGAAVRIAVPLLPHIANFDDLDPLRAEPGVAMEMVPAGRALPGDADLVILPGTKATCADLAAFRKLGWDIDLFAHARRGGAVLGICGGFQMLGTEVADPAGTEGPAGRTPGLGLLDATTEISGVKRVAEGSGRHLATGEAVRGYEMRMGRSTGRDLARPMLMLDSGPDGAVSADGRVMGCYLHGLFAADGFRRAFLQGLAGRALAGPAYEATVERILDSLAAHLEGCLDLDRLLVIAGRRQGP